MGDILKTGIPDVDEVMKKFPVKEFKRLFQEEKNIRFSHITGRFEVVPDLSRVYIFKFDENTDIFQIIQELNRLKEVEYAQPNHTYILRAIPDDPYFSRQWYLHSTGTYAEVDADIDAPEGWDILQDASSIVVAVLDTGVNKTHPDLIGNLIAGYDFSDNDSDPEDYDGHGTHVTGIIGATGSNATGISGVAWKVKIMPLKIFPNATDEVISSAIKYAVDNGARILNNSWGNDCSSPSRSQLIEDAINYAVKMGAIVVFAAGNSDTSNELCGYPASLPNVIGVGALDIRDKKSSFSNYGEWVDIVAPGGTNDGNPEHDIFSTYIPFTYAYLPGTSMAAPIVSGVAALIWAKNPNLTAAEVRQILELSATDIYDKNPSYRGLLGRGKVNLKNALNSNITYAKQGSIKIYGSAKLRGAINTLQDKAYIYFEGNDAGNYTLKIYNSLGELIHEETKFYYDKKGFFTWGDINQGSGVYTVVVEGPGIKAHSNLVVLR